jgi:hypothetical protein
MRRGGLVAFVIVAQGLAGCSSGGGGLLGPQSSSGTQAGHDSPKAAVIGFLTDLKTAGDAWCSYLDPADQSTCRQGSEEVQIKLNGNFSIGNDAIQAEEALVAVTGNLCVSESGDVTTPTTACQSNNDPNTGLPPGAGTFAQAYAAATSSSSNDTTVPCIEVNGSWYVNASNFGGGSTSATTIPATIPTTVPTTTP